MIARGIMFGAIATIVGLTRSLEVPTSLVISACLVALWAGAYWTGLKHSEER